MNCSVGKKKHPVCAVSLSVEIRANGDRKYWPYPVTSLNCCTYQDHVPAITFICSNEHVVHNHWALFCSTVSVVAMGSIAWSSIDHFFLNKVKYCRNNKCLQFTNYTLTRRDFSWRRSKNTYTSLEIIFFVSSFSELVRQVEWIIFSHRGMTRISPLIQHCCQIMTKIS